VVKKPPDGEEAAGWRSSLALNAVANYAVGRFLDRPAASSIFNQHTKHTHNPTPMLLYPNTYYHIYNRSNNREVVFRERDNYGLFIKKYRYHCEAFADTLAYCLMPTHFHLFVFVHSEDTDALRNQFGVLLGSYTHAINKGYGRHGSLFQAGTKAKPVSDDAYLATLTAYIHNNPVRSGLTERAEEWEFSSVQDYWGLRKEGTLVRKEQVLERFSDVAAFKEFSVGVVDVERGVWV
jgi:REP element-mobilizing transposase RayT